MNKPLEKFEAQEQLDTYLKEWQERLFLTDWVIKVHINCAPQEMTIADVVGSNIWQEINKSSVIRILIPIYYGDRILKYCAEKTLVHELLHIKFCLFGESGNDLQDRIQHQNVEEMAKSLIMAKYNITLDWFNEGA
jgi:hypothetical protein